MAVDGWQIMNGWGYENKHTHRHIIFIVHWLKQSYDLSSWFKLSWKLRNNRPSLLWDLSNSIHNHTSNLFPLWLIPIPLMKMPFLYFHALGIVNFLSDLPNSNSSPLYHCVPCPNKWWGEGFFLPNLPKISMWQNVLNQV